MYTCVFFTNARRHGHRTNPATPSAQRHKHGGTVSLAYQLWPVSTVAQPPAAGALPPVPNRRRPPAPIRSGTSWPTWHHRPPRPPGRGQQPQHRERRQQHCDDAGRQHQHQHLAGNQHGRQRQHSNQRGWHAPSQYQHHSTCRWYWRRHTQRRLPRPAPAVPLWLFVSLSHPPDRQLPLHFQTILPQYFAPCPWHLPIIRPAPHTRPLALCV